MPTKSIIYYSGSRESPDFESKIIDNLIQKSCGIPIIAVTQKEIQIRDNLILNICVGNVGFSYLNEWSQILIGAKEAQTDYIIFAESDFLYPESYFNLNPVSDLYMYDNVWIVMDKKYGNFFWRKKRSEGAQICRRTVLIEEYEKFLAGQPQWHNGALVIGKKGDSPLINIHSTFYSGEPCISFKTGNGLRTVTNIKHGEEYHTRTLPYWGNIEQLRIKYGC